jgi:hypothetical protein
MTDGLDRRTFIIAGVATVVAGGGLTACRSGGRTDAVLEADADPLAAIGRAYLADHPDEADLDRLLRSVPGLAGVGSRRDVRRALGDVAPSAQQDFADGRVVSVGTWRLATTEARAAAVVALLPA